MPALRSSKEETSVNQLISGLISFVWLWETSRELAQKKVEFHKIMQTAVSERGSGVERKRRKSLMDDPGGMMTGPGSERGNIFPYMNLALGF